MDDNVRKIGEDTVAKLGLVKFNKDILPFIGRLRYRTSYGQNALDHSIQVAILTGIMAAELGLDQTLAKRAGLLHDIANLPISKWKAAREVGSRSCKEIWRRPCCY
jgi:ribonuclease Y